MKRKSIKSRQNLVIISFSYLPVTLFFCVGEPVYIARNEEEIKEVLEILNKINLKQNRDIYMIDYNFTENFFKSDWWRKLKNYFLGIGEKTTKKIYRQQLKKMEEIENFLFCCEKGLWN